MTASQRKKAVQQQTISRTAPAKPDEDPAVASASTPEATSAPDGPSSQQPEGVSASGVIFEKVEATLEKAAEMGIVPETAAAQQGMIIQSDAASDVVSAIEPEQQQAEQQPLRTDGPTLEEFVAAGYAAENYPPQGYAPQPEPAKPIKRNAFGFPIYEGNATSGIGLGHAK